MSEVLVAIVGRPNVGKSTLFNRLIGSRQAIVEDNPGVTRDRMYGVAQWEGRSFMVVDTGGIDPSLDTGMPAHISAQADVAMEEADLILFVVDAKAGTTSTDQDIADQLRRGGTPVLVVANKADSPKRDDDVAESYALGVGEVFAVSSAHGRGVAELCDAILAKVGSTAEDVELIPPGIRIAFLGRPNAGKSTLVNSLLGSPRVIVSDTPGTTRDAIYLPMKHGNDDWVVIDTAGLRRRRAVARAQEKLAAIKSIRAMERTEVVVLTVDAEQGVTDQDQRIARMSFTRGKGVVVLLHKWDLIASDKKRTKEVLEHAKRELHFLENPYIVKTSVLGDGRDTGEGRVLGLEALLEAAKRTAGSLRKRVTTSDLNGELKAATTHNPPPLSRGRPVKLLFITQADRSPPLFVISANHGRSLAPAYEKFLLRWFRKKWSLRGVPLRVVVRGRGQGGDHKQNT
ncbi:MAG: ribosome biogenesis GTPase Der [Nannocystales bacterium]